MHTASLAIVELTGCELVWLAAIIAAAVLGAWTVVFLSLRNKPDGIAQLTTHPNLLYMLTVVFVTSAVVYLAMADRFANAVAPSLMAIAGFVLGSMDRRRNSPPS